MQEPKKDCCSKKHICDMMADKDALEAVKAAAMDARFICKACGRAAGDPAALCEPVSLDA